MLNSNFRKNISFILYQIFLLSILSCDPETTQVISDISPDLQQSISVFTLQGNQLVGLRQNVFEQPHDGSRSFTDLEAFMTTNIITDYPPVASPLLIIDYSSEDQQGTLPVNIYQPSGEGIVLKIRSSTGEVMWDFDSGADITASLLPSLPILSGNGLTLEVFSIIVANQAGTVSKIDKETGSILWTFNTDEETILTTPTNYRGNGIQENIAFSTVEGKIYNLDGENGSLLWMFDAGEEVMGAVQRNFGGGFNSGSSVLSFVTASGKLITLNEQGLEICSIELNKSVGQGYQMELGVQKMFLGTLDGMLYKIDLINCSIDWEIQLGTRIIAQPRIYGDIYVSDENGSLYCINNYSGSIVWEKQLNDGPLKTSPNIVEFRDDDELSSYTRILYLNTPAGCYAINADSGETHSFFDNSNPGNFRSSPSIFNRFTNYDTTFEGYTIRHPSCYNY